MFFYSYLSYIQLILSFYDQLINKQPMININISYSMAIIKKK